MIIPRRSYREQARLLREYEPWRSLWRFALGSLLLLAVPALSLGGFIAGAYLVDGFDSAARVTLGAVVALVPGQFLSGYIWR